MVYTCKSPVYIMCTVATVDFATCVFVWSCCLFFPTPCTCMYVHAIIYNVVMLYQVNNEHLVILCDIVLHCTACGYLM